MHYNSNTALTLGQYTAAEPHGSSIDDMELAGQKYPALQLPEHIDDVWLSMFPYLPDGQLLRKPDTQK